MSVAPSVQEMVERVAQRDPCLGRLVESLSAAVIEAVVLAMRPLLRGNNVRVQRSGLIQAPQRSVDRRITDVVQAVLAEPPNDVIAVAIRLRQDGQHRQIEYALEQLGGIDFCLVHMTR